jgi:hypothetical protein
MMDFLVALLYIIWALGILYWTDYARINIRTISWRRVARIILWPIGLFWDLPLFQHIRRSMKTWIRS